MQTAKQLSISLANKPGRLHAVLAALQKERVNILALTVMDSEPPPGPAAASEAGSLAIAEAS